MAKFCTECGKEMPSGVAFCTGCGTKTPADSVPAGSPQAVTATANAVPEIKSEPGAEQAGNAPPAVHTGGTQNSTQPQPHQQPYAPRHQPQTYRAQQTYSPPPQPAHQQPMPAASAADPTCKVVGTGAYFGLMLLFTLPVIGFIACIIMCFAPRNKNLKHFARAILIWAIFALVIIGLLIGVVYMMSDSLMDYINSLTNELFSG